MPPRCAPAVQRAAAKVPGCKARKSILQRKSLTVRYDENAASFADFEKAVANAGYGLIEDMP